MDGETQEKLERISYLENEGYSQDVIDAIEDFIEHPDQEMHSCNTIEEMWKVIHEEWEKEEEANKDNLA